MAHTLDLSPDDLLTTTRTVRKRLDLSRPVPIELIRECIEVAVQAPTGSNRQGWHWLVITDAGLRSAIGDIYAAVARDYLSSGSSAAGLFTDDPDRSKVQHRVGDSATWLAEHIAEVPVMVLACIETQGFPSGGFPTGTQAGLWGSLLPAAWSYQLAARARGLGSAWTTFHLAHEQQVADLLGLPDTIRQGVLLPTAYYTGETFKPAARQPLDEVLHLDRW